MMMMTMLFAMLAMKMNMWRVESSEAAAAIWRECLAVFGQHTLSMINIPPAGQSSYPRMAMRRKDKSFTKSLNHLLGKSSFYILFVPNGQEIDIFAAAICFPIGTSSEEKGTSLDLTRFLIQRFHRFLIPHRKNMYFLAQNLQTETQKYRKEKGS